MAGRLSPTTRLLLAAAFAAGVLQVETVAGLTAFAVLAGLGAWEGRVPARRLLGMVVPLLPLVILAAVHALLSEGGAPAAPGTPALVRAAVAGGRLLLLVSGAGIASLSASPPALLDALTRLLRPLERLGLPLREVTWTALLALRFLPLLRDEATTVAQARRARCGHLAARGFGGQARSVLALAVPVALRTVRRSDDLSLALRARGFRLDRDPTPRRYRWTPAEALALALLAGIIAWTACRY